MNRIVSVEVSEVKKRTTFKKAENEKVMRNNSYGGGCACGDCRGRAKLPNGNEPNCRMKIDRLSVNVL